jgi:hypothetical protein
MRNATPVEMNGNQAELTQILEAQFNQLKQLTDRNRADESALAARELELENLLLIKDQLEAKTQEEIDRSQRVARRAETLAAKESQVKKRISKPVLKSRSNR